MSRTQLDLASQAQGLLSPTYGGVSPVTQGNETLPASRKLLALQSVEINSSYSLEIPSTSSLEITGLPANKKAATANALTQWDDFSNFAANMYSQGITSTVTSGVTTALTVASTAVQLFTGSTTQTVMLPREGVPAGATYILINQSTGALSIQAASGASMFTISGFSLGLTYIGYYAICTALVVNPGAGAGQWNVDFLPINISSGKSFNVSNSLTLAGTDGTTMTFPSSSATIARIDAANTFTGHQTIEGVTSTGATGTGKFVFDAAPTISNPTINNYVEGVVTIGTVTSSNTLSLTNGTVQTATLTASTACTFTMPSVGSGKSFILLLKQAASTGNGTATFTSVKWNGAGTPTQTATAATMDIYSFISDGTDWYGTYSQGYVP